LDRITNSTALDLLLKKIHHGMMGNTSLVIKDYNRKLSKSTSWVKIDLNLGHSFKELIPLKLFFPAISLMRCCKMTLDNSLHDREFSSQCHRTANFRNFPTSSGLLQIH